MNKKVKKSVAVTKKSAGKANSKSPLKLFFKSLRVTLVYLLALYGAHTLTGQFNVSYRKAADSYLQKIWKSFSSSAKTVEDKISPLPTIIIKSPADLHKTAYDNLKIGVPSYDCTIIVDRPGYALGYSEEHEQALWVIYKLTADEVKNKKARRTDDFRSDPAIPGGSAEPEDYKRSFFDRGHLAPAADMSFSLQAMSESFYMSNMSPQRPELNRGIWKDLEEKVRDYALANDALYVVTGPIFNPEKQRVTIGKNQVTVPEKYFKVLLATDSRSPKAIGFIIDNRSDGSKKLADYAVSVNAVESITGLDFFSELAPEDEERLENQCNFSQWERSLPFTKWFKK